MRSLPGAQRATLRSACCLAHARAVRRAPIATTIWRSNPVIRWRRSTALPGRSRLRIYLDANASLVLLTPTTDPVLGWEIARDGKLLYERHSGLWMGERARLWHLYNDALPFRRALAESLRSYAEEVRHGA